MTTKETKTESTAPTTPALGDYVVDKPFTGGEMGEEVNYTRGDVIPRATAMSWQKLESLLDGGWLRRVGDPPRLGIARVRPTDPDRYPRQRALPDVWTEPPPPTREPSKDPNIIAMQAMLDEADTPTPEQLHSSHWTPGDDDSDDDPFNSPLTPTAA